MDAQLINIYDGYIQEVAISMLTDPTENPEVSEPGGRRAWIGLKKDKNDEQGTGTYKWTARWLV